MTLNIEHGGVRPDSKLSPQKISGVGFKMSKMTTMRVFPLAAGVLALSVALFASTAQSDQEQVQSEQPLRTSSSPPSTPASRSASRITDVQRSKHADNFYRSVWGVEKLEVRETASGVLLRFSYQVTDPKKAEALNDKKSTPYLIDEKTGAVLQVPQMPKVGLLRQSAAPESGREYWMVFSNKGKFVKPQSRVDVVIGQFRANGLIVQ